MKRIFPIIISVIMITSILLTGCTSGINKLSVKDSADASVELLTKALKEDRSFSAFTDTVSAWADENDIDIAECNDKYLVITRDAAETSTSSESFTFHAGIDLSNEEMTENSIVSAAGVMTGIYSPENHDSLTGIFTLIQDGDPAGAEELPEKYLDTDNFIDITFSNEEMLCNSISTVSDMEARKDLDMTSPTYTEAYRITLSGKENQSAYKSRGTYPNAIKTIGDLLAACQTSTILFELASFEGGDDTSKLPSQATAVIVLHENDIDSFTGKFDKSYAKVEEAYEDADDPEVTFEYTMEPVDLPSVVISKEDTENVVSLMYTMINGNYLRDEKTDEVVAVSNIGKISTSGGTFKLGLNAKSLDTNVMDDIHTDVATICALSDIKYKELSTTPSWTNKTNSGLPLTLSDTMNIELTCNMENKTSSIFVTENPNLNLVIYGCEQQDLMNGIDAIIDYMGIAGVNLPAINN